MYKKSLSYPHLVWMTLFVVAPMIIIFIYAFTVTNDGGQICFTLENFVKFFDKTNVKSFFNSIWR